MLKTVLNWCLEWNRNCQVTDRNRTTVPPVAWYPSQRVMGDCSCGESSGNLLGGGKGRKRDQINHLFIYSTHMHTHAHTHSLMHARTHARTHTHTHTWSMVHRLTGMVMRLGRIVLCVRSGGGMGGSREAR